MSVRVHLLKPLYGWLTKMSSQCTWSHTSLGPFALYCLCGFKQEASAVFSYTAVTHYESNGETILEAYVCKSVVKS